MTETVNFSELAQVRVGDVERPKPLPNGHYIAQFTGPMKEHKAKSGNIAMRFPYKLIGAGTDVDTDQLEAAGGLPEKEFALDFWMSPDARYRFTDFGKAMGANDQLNLIELASWLVENNQPFTLEAKQEQGDKPGPDGQPQFYTRFDNPAPAE